MEHDHGTVPAHLEVSASIDESLKPARIHKRAVSFVNVKSQFLIFFLLSGNAAAICCLHVLNNTIVSGSSDRFIKVWSVIKS
jgi:WD40 repeat protein